jgi:hypothetical protein
MWIILVSFTTDAGPLDETNQITKTPLLTSQLFHSCLLYPTHRRTIRLLLLLIRLLSSIVGITEMFALRDAQLDYAR